MLVFFSLVACLVVALGESLQSRAWAAYRRGERQKLDRVAAERLIALSVPAPSRDSSAVLLRIGTKPRPAQRALDLVVASTSLVLASPLLTLVAVLIRLDSRGPIFYRQERLGRGGRPFVLLRFRTMVDGAGLQRQLLHDFISQSEGLLLSAADDPRMTRVGVFLRRHSIDELPSLWNILVGHMSLVGPRPLTHAQLDSALAEGAERLAVRPGLVPPTLMAVLQGHAVDPHADLDYARHPSLERDLRLLWMVFGHVAREVGKTEIRAL